MGRLIVIPTPIGNLEDITLRAIRILKESDIILAEDTRTAGKLLRHYEITTPVRSHHKDNEHKNLARLLHWLRGNKQIAMISEAGTPGISDPGFLLIRGCIEQGIEIETLPGPTAMIPALVNSGIPCDRFHFEGFLPPRKHRNRRLAYLATLQSTIILYESPYRLGRTLLDLEDSLGTNRPASISRELTKIHEETRRGTLAELAIYYSKHTPKGEFVIIIGPES
ncbi:MAG: 16S rRNA (cytidine(1402)-2'-O)-methyltransferase [Chlorobi bacterium]|nr:16S rRNA (cytidine(1402)-2'-O)-methyltransferase [Chlorobiota bacterium]